jgi:hypothetical protein
MENIQNKNLAQELSRTGIVVEPYKRGPIGKDIFTISIQPTKGGIGKVRLWEGNAKIEVYTDKAHKQAVLSVKEQPRVITKKVIYTDYWTHTGKPSKKQIHAKLQETFNVNVPENTKWSFKDEKVEDIDNNPDNPTWKYSGTVIATVPQRSRMTFLVGKDEKAHFICALPKKASSVEEAHDILRPRNVPKDAKRQGEWFFVEVSQFLQKKFNKLASAKKYFVYEDVLENGSTHIAKELLKYKGKKYAIGFIIDERNNRHHGLFLPTWHRVVRNNEIIPEDPIHSRYWD